MRKTVLALILGSALAIAACGEDAGNDDDVVDPGLTSPDPGLESPDPGLESPEMESPMESPAGS